MPQPPHCPLKSHQGWKMSKASQSSQEQMRTCSHFGWWEKVHCGWGCQPPEYVSYCLWCIRCSSCDAEQESCFSDGFCSCGKWLKINTTEYLNIPNDVLLPWIRRHYDATKVMLVRDSASAHGTKQVQTYLKEILPLFVPKDIWPSSSLDLNVRDYRLFSVIEIKSNVNPQSNVNSLKASIRRAFRNLDADEVKRSCLKFRLRISKMIVANGDHIE